jgi:hypothetical protein
MIRSTLSLTALSFLVAQAAIAQTAPPPITDLAFPGQTTQTYSQPYYGTNPGSIIYRVVIDSSDPLVLQQVKRIEPKAFFQMFSGNRVLIQTGAFATEYAARQQMALLTRSGYQSILISQSPGNGPIVTPPSSSTVIGRGYYAIVPSDPETEREMLNTIISSGINGDQIQFRLQPFGRHYSIGPWSKRNGAEDMVKFLREQTKVDARVYYQR